MRINFNELIDMIDDPKALMDEQGNVKKNSPLYSELRNIIFFNLIDELGQQAADEYIKMKHANLEDVGLGYKEIFDILKKDKFLDNDPMEEFFSGLLHDDEYSTYDEIKNTHEGWNAKKFYELNSELGDRKDNMKRYVLARVFKEMLKQENPPAKESKDIGEVIRNQRRRR